MLKWFYEDGSTVAVRPSGTEPKIKFYFGVKANDPSLAPDALWDKAQAKLAGFRDEIIALAEAE